ncbi:hypothetical protein QR98_0024230 [Sarcoptes scabiei]|uniref:Uncharacterized protein n=1 Tax=Sarcoptes scabiei TaxID=52283 RepID=A0A131ZZ70_SARSC|nr:hypothetical protein QR98_0024230 [Sarcoptes scabiei]
MKWVPSGNEIVLKLFAVGFVIAMVMVMKINYNQVVDVSTIYSIVIYKIYTRIELYLNEDNGP